MRADVAVTFAIASTVLGAGLVACIDLFHSTSDVLTACEIDARTPGCTIDAGADAHPDASTDFCSWSHSQALANAQHACAWLGACEGAVGQNAFGACVFHALLAYDCGANPDHPARGKTHELWDCMWQAQTCVAVTACVFPKGPQACGGSGVGLACATVGGTPPNNLDVLADCVDGGQAHGENCALWDQTCESASGGFLCGGSADGGDCADLCAGTALHLCTDAGDIGIDCADNGAQQCGVFDGGGEAWAACLPSGDAGCPPSLSVRCQSGVAMSCPAGRAEAVDCDELLGQAGCRPGTLSPAFDWTSACTLIPADASDDAGASTDASTCVEACDGGMLTGCFRGAAFPFDCTAAALGACRMDGAHATCSPP